MTNVNVLVLYYSSYGHIELMAQAQAEGAARISQARVAVKRVPETMPPEVAKASGCKLDQAAPIASPKNSIVRCDHFWHADPVRQHGRADAELPRPDGSAMGARRAGRKNRVCFLQHRQSAWRSGNHDHLVSHDAAPSRDDHRRIALYLQGARHDEGNHRRHPLRRELRDRIRRGCADAERSRVGDVPLSGRARDPHIEATRSRNECQVNR